MRKTIAYSGQASVPQSAETTLRAMYTSCVSGWASVARLVGDLAGRQGGVVQPRATVLRKRCDVTPERAGGASQLLALAVECALSLGISAYLGDQRLAALAFHDRGGSTCRPAYPSGNAFDPTERRRSWSLFTPLPIPCLSVT